MVVFLFLERHEQRVIRQPFGVFLGERGDLFAHLIVHAGICLAEQRPAGVRELLEVRLVRRGLEVAGLDLGRGQQAVLDQQVKVDQVRVARRGGKALVGRIAEAGVAERQHLPVGLVRICKEIDKVIGCLAHRAHAVRRGLGGDVRKHATGAFEHTFLPPINMQLL